MIPNLDHAADKSIQLTADIYLAALKMHYRALRKQTWLGYGLIMIVFLVYPLGTVAYFFNSALSDPLTLGYILFMSCIVLFGMIRATQKSIKKAALTWSSSHIAQVPISIRWGEQGVLCSSDNQESCSYYSWANFNQVKSSEIVTLLYWDISRFMVVPAAMFNNSDAYQVFVEFARARVG